MTDFEFAKEVAENVWGWTPLTEDNFGEFCSKKAFYLKLATHLSGRSIWSEEGVKKEVNSWAGFGKTVEAMAERYVMRYLGDRFAGYCGDEVVRTFIIKQPEGWSDMKALIKSTHAAALDAVKEIRNEK